MDCSKVGELIRSLRVENHLTQKQLADAMNISDKTISKWERGLGCPDVSVLAELSNILGVNIEGILTGELDQNDTVKGNIEKIRFYVCPDCGNIITSTGKASLFCCGRKLEQLVAKKAEEGHKLEVEVVEDEWYITSEHEMTKSHYISFAAFVTGDKVTMFKQYPEWNLQFRVQKRGHGKLYYYCVNHGLFYMIL